MTNLRDKVIIEVGLNEGQMRASNPNIPYTPEEIAADARRCLDAGASVVHYHARDPVTAVGTTDVEANIAVQKAVTEATPMIAYPTYGEGVPVLDGHYMIGPPADFRFRHFVEGVRRGVRFEVGPIDLGAFYDFNAIRTPGTPGGPGRVEGWTLSGSYQLNSGQDHLWLASFCDANGLHQSFAAPDTMCLLNLRNLIDMGLVHEPTISLKLFFWSGAALATRYRGMRALAQELFADQDVRWMPVVQAADGFPLAALALGEGGDVRTGIGDYHYGDAGAPSNAELVERVVLLARAFGREPATPEEARAIKGLAPLNAAPRKRASAG